MPNFIEATCRRIGAAVAPHPGRHTRGAAPRVRPYAPRVPHTPAPEPYPVPPQQASPVRPYVLDADHCARRRADHREAEQAHTEHPRPGVTVRLDTAATAATPAPQAGRVLAGVAS